MKRHLKGASLGFASRLARRRKTGLDDAHTSEWIEPLPSAYPEPPSGTSSSSGERTFSGKVSDGRFNESTIRQEATDAFLPPAFDFRQDSLERQLRQVYPQRIQNAANYCASATTVRSLVRLAGVPILARMTQSPLALVVRSVGFRMDGVGEQFVLAEQSNDLVGQVEKVVLGFVARRAAVGEACSRTVADRVNQYPERECDAPLR